MDKNTESLMTLRLDPEIAAALQRRARAHGRESVEEIMWIIFEALGNDLPAAYREWMRRREEIVQRFGFKAVEIIQAEGWRDDIIAETERRLRAEDQAWVDGYQMLLNGAAIFDKRVKEKQRVNPMLGRRVKSLLGAETGKPFSVKQPSIFSRSSTLLQPQQAAA